MAAVISDTINSHRSDPEHKRTQMIVKTEKSTTKSRGCDIREQAETKTEGLAGNWESLKIRRNESSMDVLNIVQRERTGDTPWMCLPAVLAGFQVPCVTLSISALL